MNSLQIPESDTIFLTTAAISSAIITAGAVARRRGSKVKVSEQEA